ncbi:MAG: hypothetical protein ACD_78C00193G0002 [uncultured bacterium (gcode 4)]|uniref:Uncharacterized protein n=3 Tax=Bacteria TaxID=2 RepID=K1YXB0_9BACT|nr:MAG: hypothetical protein ACD_78C00193G0002 [uncultured bacterium (gcode 4)]OGY16228.1 MAG: hypothetical protein A2785_01395 [Candidatus Chisholmbacteria bacterium RIFCSPHIGHO2_01_FULL_49_18]OGY21799.1 MAG: hypothetical protein A3A65_02420 [Candidatus Chisholmbacteria bacterium RIFCSPLOWO2_01_FULL_49_14]
MKVYFMATPRGKDDLSKNYREIYSEITGLGYEHVTDFILDVDVDEFYLADIRPFYKKTLQELKKADICVFETSVHSLAIGHLIGKALDNGKPVIALYTGKNAPFFLSGVEEKNVQIVKYDLSSVRETLKQALYDAGERADSRFNFFISRKLTLYLDWISQKKRIPRAVYLRQLIRREMKNTRWTLAES